MKLMKPHTTIFPNLLRTTLTAGLLFTTVAATTAKDHVLTIGGGYSPAGNQISLERNVVFFRKLLGEQLPQTTAHDIFFADGNSKNADLQYVPEKNEVPKANRIAAMLFGREDYLDLKYRNTELGKVNGVSSPENITKWFKETGSQLKSGDRLILYVTAHGGRSRQKDNPHHTTLMMWNGEWLTASALAGHIKTLPKGVSVFTVMVQCYSGGFSHLIFNENNVKKGDSERDICGFYSTVHNRLAAGCTPEINEENYDEYSSHFWAALRGKSRTDKSVESADYDGSGEVSFEEAHAFAVLVSRNVDVPVKTSDAYLRAHSRLQKPAKKTEDSKGKEKEKPAKKAKDTDKEKTDEEKAKAIVKAKALSEEREKEKHLLSRKTPYFKLLSLARPVELATLEGLTGQLGLTGNGRIKKAEEAAAALEKERKDLANKDKELKKQYESAKKAVRTDLRNRWPDLSNTLSPGALRLLTSDAGEFVKAAESHEKFKELTKLFKDHKEIEGKRFELDKKWAWHQRFLRAVDNIALAANLPRLADEKVLARYQRLLDAESTSLRSPLVSHSVIAEETKTEAKKAGS
ncbi:MAG: hypothetical protein OSA93_17775 [Akkermansiaceae bacterium]|jgi:hypothetical protein|nr:hypothetical protein [Akkermansiaceae bacterium]